MAKMTIPEDAIDPGKVPQKTLVNGATIPAVGLGTFGSDNYTATEIADAVADAIVSGYRHIDCASVYSNEPEIGQTFTKVFDSGVVKREDLWITSKLWNNMHGDGDVLLSCAQSLKDLQLDYLDLYLVHWPFPNYHAPGCDVTSRNPDAKPYVHENFMKTWRQMERLVEMGLVRHIGTSNMTIPKMTSLLKDAKIKPVCNEMELHPHFHQPELYDFCVSNDIQPIGYCPIGSPNRPERDKTADDTVPLTDPVIIRIAERLDVHPAIVCLKWAVQRGQIPIPFSVKRPKYLSNLRAVTENPLTDQDMADIAKIDQNCRFIKGQVFLWKENQDWQDLWDVNGEIAS